MEELPSLVLADMAGGALLAMDGVRAIELDSVKAQEVVEAALVADGVEAEGEEVGEEGGDWKKNVERAQAAASEMA